MAFDGLILNSIIKELKVLINGRVNRIYEPNKNELIFSIYSNKVTYALNIDISANNYRLNLTTKEKSNPYVAPNFCMLLRKHLIGSKINKIYMNNLERIAFIDFECFNEMNDKITRTLAIELMGKYSNVILLNQNKIIIDALKKFDNENLDSSSRNIMPARKYILPNSSKKDILNFSEKDFINFCIEKSNNTSYTLDNIISSNFTGISKLFVQSALEELKLSNTVTNSSLIELYSYILNIINSNNLICKEYKNNYTICLNLISESKEPLQINFFLDDFYFSKYQKDIFINYRNNLLKIINVTLDKITRKLDNIDRKIYACKDLEKYKTFGELLIANIYRIDTKKTSNKFVEVENYYDNNSIIQIPIDNDLTTSQNAEKYYKKYNKLKNTLEIVKIQKKDSEKELDYLGSLIYELDNANDLDSVNEIYNEISENILFNDTFKSSKNNKKENISSIENYLRLKIDNYTVLVGKNNRQNDYLTMKVASDNDYWFHAKEIHGSHVILRCNGDTPKTETIIKCAQIAAYYSKAKFSSNVPVDYTLRKYVKKPNGASPGYVIYTNQKTINVEPSSGISINENN